MRKPLGVLVGFCVFAILVLVVVAATTNERRAFTLGVVPAGPTMNLAPNDQVCQAPITIPDGDADFDRVAFTLGTVDGPRPPIDVTLRTLADASVAHGSLPAGAAAPGRSTAQSVDVGHVATRAPMRVCLRNTGRSTVAVYGNGDLASRTGSAVVGGKPAGVDISLVFDRAEKRSALSMLPTYFSRASLWRTGWTGAWTYWLLGALVVLAVPALLAVALRSTLREP
jgi:hypothetical protein